MTPERTPDFTIAYGVQTAVFADRFAAALQGVDTIALSRLSGPGAEKAAWEQFLNSRTSRVSGSTSNTFSERFASHLNSPTPLKLIDISHEDSEFYDYGQSAEATASYHQALDTCQPNDTLRGLLVGQSLAAASSDRRREAKMAQQLVSLAEIHGSNIGIALSRANLGICAILGDCGFTTRQEAVGIWPGYQAQLQDHLRDYAGEPSEELLNRTLLNDIGVAHTTHVKATKDRNPFPVPAWDPEPRPELPNLLLENSIDKLTDAEVRAVLADVDNAKMRAIDVAAKHIATSNILEDAGICALYLPPYRRPRQANLPLGAIRSWKARS